MLVQDSAQPEEIMRPGHAACPGCGVAIGMRMVLRALGKRAVVVVVPSCVAVISGPYPHAAFEIPMFHSAFEIAAPTAAAIACALKVQGKDDIPVLTFAGDGGTFDIGLQSLSGAADRNEDFIYVCMDNEAYMNTGIQVSSATPQYAWTGTSPRGNVRGKKQIMEIMAAHRIPYAATACIGFPEDLQMKVKKARTIRGTRFLHLLSPCPTGWKMEEHMAPKVAVAAVETNIFPLYEVVDGLHYTINYVSKSLPVETYLNMQGRFSHLNREEIQAIQLEADRAWAVLKGKTNNKV
ncbi:MAG: pyruvate synthase subunit beta [Deltaproteobacteria bacterium]|nr:pyruvate synthase subunit beta [Deltaproteobacteria bacterium]MBW2044153.1 pyruvate synthase subunit beta [Deltaproteobacteria bacterium]MBW2300538.1 pyruvate synthase subunit beta [Deltaproteobacteria bacterium]